MFTDYSGGWDNNKVYGQGIEVMALVNGEEIWISIESFCKVDLDLHNIVCRFENHWSRHSLEKVIGKSETPLPDDRVTSYDHAWEFLAKKRSYSRLKQDGVVDHIEKWANMMNGHNLSSTNKPIRL